MDSRIDSISIYTSVSVSILISISISIFISISISITAVTRVQLVTMPVCLTLSDLLMSAPLSSSTVTTDA
jgi:hypothetical protein